MDIYSELEAIINDLQSSILLLNQEKIQKPITSLEKNINKIGKCFSGSWLGYHAYVYYKDLKLPPAGAHFSQDWGIDNVLGISMLNMGTRGEWVEYRPEEIKHYLLDISKCENIDDIKKMTKPILNEVENNKRKFISVLYSILKNEEDSFISEILEKVKKINILSSIDVIQFLSPKGKIMTRDELAYGQGLRTPPHLDLYSQILPIRNAIQIASDLISITEECIDYLKRGLINVKKKNSGTNIFIGHGHSGVWRDLKDFVNDRLHLPWDEFNRIPVAGMTNIVRLAQLLDESCFAFLIMTAEDELKDGDYQARMNVIHEVGLFQGRLGFEKAIILLEEGCKEFSNIAGLGQIRFPKDNISAAFEEIRKVLEREGIIN